MKCDISKSVVGNSLLLKVSIVNFVSLLLSINDFLFVPFSKKTGSYINSYSNNIKHTDLGKQKMVRYNPKVSSADLHRIFV